MALLSIKKISFTSMYPFGYGPATAAEPYLSMQKNISNVVTAAIKSINGNTYKIGSPYSLLCNCILI